MEGLGTVGWAWGVFLPVTREQPEAPGWLVVNITWIRFTILWLKGEQMMNFGLKGTGIDLPRLEAQVALGGA